MLFIIGCSCLAQGRRYYDIQTLQLIPLVLIVPGVVKSLIASSLATAVTQIISDHQQTTEKAICEPSAFQTVLETSDQNQEMQHYEYGPPASLIMFAILALASLIIDSEPREDHDRWLKQDESPLV